MRTKWSPVSKGRRAPASLSIGLPLERHEAILGIVKLGPYEVLETLGKGGMGIVFRVRSPAGDEAALKLLMRADTATFASFERERRLLASLGDADGFVGLLDAGTSPEGIWLVMPLVPGGTLRKRLEKGPLGVEETVALGIERARALGAAHARGIVHRDVKPENVLFTASGRALLADLGLAKHFDRAAPGGSQSLSQTTQGAVKGTVGYMAPEQLEDARSVEPPADVFSLGAVLYDCLAGRPAFAGDTVLELIERLERGVVEPIGRSDVPRWLERVVMQALAPDPRDRFADGGSLARALVAGKRSRRALPRVLGLAAVLCAAGLAAFATAPRRGAPGSSRLSPPPRSLLATGSESERAAELDSRGRAHTRKGELADAIADLTRAIELDPLLASAWANRGVARYRSGDRDGALADTSKAIELVPGLAEAWSIRSGARIDKGDLDGGIRDATRAIELDPGRSGAWSNRGAARLYKGDLAGRSRTRRERSSSTPRASWPGRTGEARA